MNANLIKLSDSSYVIEGNLSFDTVKEISQKAAKLLSFNQEVTVDFEKLNHCDSAGIAFILQWQKKAKAHHMSLNFINMTTQMKSLLQLMGLDSLFK